jgi:hypothetical protein
MKISRERLVSQAAGSAIKLTPLNKGAVLTLMTKRSSSITDQATGNVREFDTLLFTHADGVAAIPAGELLRFKKADGSSLISLTDEAQDELEIPAKMTVVSKQDRVVNGETVYPIQARAGYQQFRIDNDINALLKTPLAENHGFAPVQDYVVQ